MLGGRRRRRWSWGPCPESSAGSGHGGGWRRAAGPEAGARRSRCRPDEHRAPGLRRTQRAPVAARVWRPPAPERTPHAPPSPPATGHLRGTTHLSCSAPQAGPPSRRSAGDPCQPPPGAGSWPVRSAPRRGWGAGAARRHVRLSRENVSLPAPRPRAGSNRRGRPRPPSAREPIGARRGAGGSRLPVLRPPGGGGRDLPARRSQSALREGGEKLMLAPPLLPAAAGEGPQQAARAKRPFP